LDDDNVLLVQGVATRADAPMIDAALERLQETLKVDVPGMVRVFNEVIAAEATQTAVAGLPTVPPEIISGGEFSLVKVGEGPCVGVGEPEFTPPSPKREQFTAPEGEIDPAKVYCAILTTEKGRIVIQLYPKLAPQHVRSFVFLARQGFYDGITWHRVIPDFVAQTGDPTGTGTGGPGYTVPLEANPVVRYDREGVLGMARSNAPDSAGSQFFITFGPQPGLNAGGATGAGYTIFGQVVEGMDVVRAVRARNPQGGGNLPPGDTLVSVRIAEVEPATE
jgi:peptidylprolyl isomerase